MSEKPVALVVGGSGDIGRAVVARLAREGYQVAITARTTARLDEALAVLRAGGAEARGWLCDLADEPAIATLFDEIRGTFGRLDVLVNAAGISEPRLIMKADQRHLEQTLRVNLVGAALLARQALLLMREARRGAIVNVGSEAGAEGQKGFGAYSASKGGLMAFSDSLREEAGRFGIRVATISPGKVDTRLHGTDPQRPNMIRPEDVAEAVMFLLRLSPAAAVRDIRIHNAGLTAE